jgi:virginiamycin B lyase
VWRATLAASVVACVVVTAVDASPPVDSMAHLLETRVRAIVRVSGFPDWITAGYGSIWLANGRGVLQIDPRTNRVVRTLARGTKPCEGITAGFGSVWTVDCGRAALVRLDPSSGRVVKRIPLLPGSPQSEGYITADRHGLWVPVGAGLRSALYRIDPATGRVVARVRLPYDSSAAAAGFGAVWVTSASANVVYRIDPATNAVAAKIKVHPMPRFIASGAGGVWSLNQGDGSVSHIDPVTNRVVSTIQTRVPGSGGCIAAGYGRVWVTMPGTPFSEIDAHSNAILGQWTGVGGDCITTGFGSVWLVNHDLVNVWRTTPHP